jgi:hypothetical protein
VHRAGRPGGLLVDELEHGFEEVVNLSLGVGPRLAGFAIGAGAFHYCRDFSLDFATVGA